MRDKGDLLSELNLIKNAVFRGEQSILDTTKKMGILAKETIKKVIENFVIEFELDTSHLPFAVFLFGSPSRNLMLPNSDLDIGLVFKGDCSDKIKVLLHERFKALPFEQVDIAGWSSIEEMKKENCLDMIEYSKATDAKFVTGNQEISKQYIALIRDKDTKEDKANRFITEFGLFHKHDYFVKKTEKGPNLKYDFGASRDIIFLDWFYILNSNDNKKREQKISPFFIKGLDILFTKKLISLQKLDQLKFSIDIILLVKFILRSEYVRTKDDMLLRLNSYSLHKCYFEAQVAFEKIGINNVDNLIDVYYNAKLALHNLVKVLYDEIAILNHTLTKIWDVAKTAIKLDVQILKILENKIWHELLPFAISSKSPKILEFILDSIILDSPGYEYILRIISENNFITTQMKQKLLSSKLADKYKKKLII